MRTVVIVRRRECGSSYKNAFNPSHAFAVRPQYRSYRGGGCGGGVMKRDVTAGNNAV